MKSIGFDIDGGTIFFMILVLILLNQFNIDIYNLIKFILVIYFLYYINPNMFTSLKNLLVNYIGDMYVSISPDKKVVNIESDKKLVLSTKTENIYNFDRNMNSTETGNRSMDTSYTDKRNFNSLLNMTSNGAAYEGDLYK